MFYYNLFFDVVVHIKLKCVLLNKPFFFMAYSHLPVTFLSKILTTLLTLGIVLLKCKFSPSMLVTKNMNVLFIVNVQLSLVVNGGLSFIL